MKITNLFVVNTVPQTEAQASIEVVEIRRQHNKDVQEDDVTPAEALSKPIALQHVCTICFDTFPARGVECPSHFMCDDCFTNYCQVQIIEFGRTYIHCPQHGCDFDYVGRLGQGMFDQMLSNKRIKNVFTKNCATCKSENSLTLGEYNPQLKSRVNLLCNQCQEIFCLFCGDPLFPSSTLLGVRFCANPFRRQLCNRKYRSHACSNSADAQKLQDYVCNPANQVKPCPHCFKLIHKVDGCRNVTCAGSLGCGQSFCYDCLSPTQNHQCPAEPLPWRTRRALDYLLQPIVRRISSGIQCVLQVLSTPCRMMYRGHLESLARKAWLWRYGYPQVLTFQGISIYNVPRKAIRGYISSVGSQQVAGMWSTTTTTTSGTNQGEEQQQQPVQGGGCYRAYLLHPNAVVYLHTHPAIVHCNGQSLSMSYPNGAFTQQETRPEGLATVAINFNTIQANRIVERVMGFFPNDHHDAWDGETSTGRSDEEEDDGPDDVRWAEALRQLAELAGRLYHERMLVRCTP